MTKTNTIVSYTNKNLLISPRKLRLVVEQAKKMSPQKAVEALSFTNSKGARLLVKCIKNVIADAKNNYGLDPSTLHFVHFTASEGLKLKRMDKSHGARFARGVIIKRHSRLNIQLTGQPKNNEEPTQKITDSKKLNKKSSK